MPQGIINDTIRLSMTFRAFSAGPEPGALEDPNTVVLTITEISGQSIAPLNITPIHVSTGTYSYDWTPSQAGTYRAKFFGTFSDSSVDTLEKIFTISSDLTGTAVVGTPLYFDEVITMAGIIEPLYLNPDELVGIYTDATELDIAEAIWLGSIEVKELLKLADGVEPPFIALEYIKAQASCTLGREFEFGSGDEVGFRLGDLSVNNKAFPKQNINRGNASTWCELAAALRKEMLFTLTSTKAYTRGGKYVNPIPSRKLRRESLLKVAQPIMTQGLIDGFPMRGQGTFYALPVRDR